MGKNSFGLILGHYAINITISISLSKALIISTHFHMSMMKYYCCLDDFYTLLGSYSFGGYTAVKLSYTKVSTFKKNLAPSIVLLRVHVLVPEGGGARPSSAPLDPPLLYEACDLAVSVFYDVSITFAYSEYHFWLLTKG